MGATVDPLFKFDEYNDRIRGAINSSKYILVKEPVRKAVLEPNPQVPRLYGLPKVHKIGSPMRPVVSFISAPSYKLAKYLDTWYKQLVDFRSPYSVKNSIELAETLTQTSPPPVEVLSYLSMLLDCIPTFPSIPLRRTWKNFFEMLMFPLP